MKRKRFVLLIMTLVALSVFLIWQNNDIVITDIKYTNARVPEAFDGFKIVQVSDLHNTEFGKNHKRFIENIKICNPDIIIVTGDIVDRRRYDIDVAENFIRLAKEIAPVYYVSGNHEAWSGKYHEVIQRLSATGITLLEDDSVNIVRYDQEISILGLSDPATYISQDKKTSDYLTLGDNLSKISQENSFKVLLSHRPELIDIYSKYKVDLVFSGHAHGGQIRLPFIGAIIAPNQGWLPKYTSGIHVKGNTTLVISRGLGNSLFPFRVFNRPEIISLELCR